MEALLLRYGYALLFFGVALEGEGFLLAGGFLAHRGDLHLLGVIGVAIAANSVADQIYYLVARARGRAWLEARYAGNPRYERLVSVARRRGVWLLLASRFLFGFRILIPAACGALGMPLRVFTPVNLVAGALWAIPTGLLGYAAGSALAGVLVDVHRYEIRIALGAVLLPVAIAAAWRARRIPPLRDLRWNDLHALLPLMIGLLGVLNVVSAIAPRSPAALVVLERWLPLAVIQQSRSVMLLAGVALLQVTRGLGRRKQLAWWVAVVALSASAASHLGRGLDLAHTGTASALLAYLLVFRRRFYARSDPASLRWGLIMAPVLACLVVLYGASGLDSARESFAWGAGVTPLSAAARAGILILEPNVEPLTPRAATFLDSLQVAGWLARFYVLVLLLRPVVLRRRLEAPADEVRRLLDRYGDWSLAAFAAGDDKHHLLLAEGQGLVGYVVRGSVAFACGDPIAAAGDLPTCAAAFVGHCRRNGWIPCIYEAGEPGLGAWESLGMRSLKIAEEALVELGEFSLVGGRRAALRSMVNRARRAGLEVRAYRRAEGADAGLDEQLEEISEEWLASKQLDELGFTMSRFSLDALAGVHVFVCVAGERVVAFCSWLPYRAGRAAVLDLMRKRDDAASGSMDLLLAESLLGLKDRGLVEASLANAPLANVGGPRGPLDRGVALLFENLNAFYGYKNLFQFKKKFAPRWEGRYLVYPRGVDLPAIAYALSRVHGSGSLLRLLSKHRF